MNNVTLCAISYEFVKPKDENGNPINGRTSLSISKEINSKLGTFEYEYNKNRFISKIKEVYNGNASTKTYKYDEFSRLVESANGDGSKIYKYKFIT